jgi:hypothetical protein
MFERRDWRERVVDYAHARRLELTACPVSFDVVLATASSRNEELRLWVRENLRNGVMLRTAQAEHIADGRSVKDTARITGVSMDYVVYTLTRLEEEEAAIADFYIGNGAA